MPDARLPGRWLTDIRFDRLSDRAHRTFTNSLMFAVENGTDGLIERRQMRFLHPDGVDDRTESELVAAGLWFQTVEGVKVLKTWSETQTKAEDLEKRREAARDRQRLFREKHKPQSVTERVTRDVTRESLRLGQGLASPPNEEIGGGGALAVTRDVTRNNSEPPARYCLNHPNGTADPCWACARAREGRQAYDKAHSVIPLRPRTPSEEIGEAYCAHKWLPDGTCNFCTARRSA